MSMRIADTPLKMGHFRSEMQGAVAFVPTMGALHEGHRSLIRAARKDAGEHNHVIVSIFVNPTQFGPNEDLTRYPRPLELDLEMCRAEKVDCVFAPSVEAMYPSSGIAADVTVPQIAADLEGTLRPGHFNGVCRVVAKLFHICQPHFAYFGRKDYQQLTIIQAMVDDLHFGVRIIACPTIRDPDGLAMSSRNVYLTPQDRAHALGLSKALREAKMLVENGGETDPQHIESAMRQVMEAHHVAVDYAVVRHPQTLAKLDCIEPKLTGGVVALVAGRVGASDGKPGVHLIDNDWLGSPEGLNVPER